MIRYERERNLNEKPLAIDLLIHREKGNGEVDNEIGEFFRKKNVLEYKSPGDSMGAEAYYKATAYACLYKAAESVAEGLWEEDITVTLYRQNRPGKLLGFLKRKGIAIDNPHPGIYRVEKGLAFPTQIIVGKELDWERHPWVKAITGKLTEKELREIVELAVGLGEKRERDLADAVLQVCTRANKKTMQKLKEGDDIMCQALMELMEPELRQSREAGRDEERINTLKEKERADRAEKEVRELRAILQRAGIPFSVK